MITELFKIIKGTYDPVYIPHLEFVELSEGLIRTRCNKYKLVQHQCHYDLRKFNFSNRITPIWNSLSNYVVSSDTVNTFKHHFDKFWCNQDVVYNYKADLGGTGNRSTTYEY